VGRVITWAAGGVLAVVLVIVATAAGVVSAMTGGGTGGEVCLATATGTGGTSAPLTADQTRNAEVIVAVGARMRVPVRGWVIAVATALQESGLINLGDLGTANDRDSLGLFQQRPSQGWGTPAQIMNPEYAARKFYEALLAVPGWQMMPVGEAAQRVQKSVYPDAYAAYEARATAIVNAIGASLGVAVCRSGGPVLTWAETWLTAWGGGPVPYLSSGDPGTWFGGYRRDCSGYASMALGLPGPGLNTSGLAARSTRISRAELRPGDLLINTAPNLAGHVVIFDHWADVTRRTYWGFEQSGDGGTHHRVIDYPYFGDYPMTAYRFSAS
jgi:hypothetical protein